MLGTRFVRRMILLGGALLLIVILQLLPERDFQRAANAEHLVEHTLRVLRASERLLAVLEAAEAGQRGYLLTGDHRYLEPYEAALSSQGPARQNLRELTADNTGQQARIAKLDRLVDTRLAGLGHVIAVYRTEGQDAAQAEIATDAGRSGMEQIRDLLGETEQEEYGLLHLRTKASEGRANHTRWILSALLTILLIVGGAVGEREIRNFDRVGNALRSSEEGFRTLANAIPQLCWTANADGWIFWYNQRWYDFTGTTLQQMDGWGWQSVHDPEVLPTVLETWKKAIDAGEPFEMDFPLRAADGAFHPFLTRVMPVRDEGGKVVRWFGTNTDITAHCKTENALRESQERLQLAQQVARIGTFEWDLQSGVKQRSPEVEAMHGLPPGEFAASKKTWLDWVVSEDRELVSRRIQEALGTGVFEEEWRVIWPDNQTHWLFGRASVLKDETGKPLRYIGALMDITERKQLEERFLRAQKLEGVGRLACGIAHDFNNLLTVISGYSQLTLDGLPRLDPLRAGVEEVLRAGTLAASITRQLLISSRHQPSRIEVLVLNDVVVGAQKMLGRLIGADVRLAVRLDPAAGAIRADAGQIEQVIMNLVVNARDAMPRGGKLVIETTRRIVGEHLDLPQGQYTAISVSDTGTGISSEVRAHIFEPFFTTKGVGKGTGLGLSTVHGIVKQCGGSISVESEVGRGTKFTILLPTAEVESGEAAALPDVARPTASETILLADDDPGVRRLCQLILGQEGYQVLACSNGVEAIERARQHPAEIHLLLTDVVMPEMGGEQLAATFTACRPGIPVLYIYAYSGMLGPDVDPESCLQKPFSAEVLLARIRTRLELHRRQGTRAG